MRSARLGLGLGLSLNGTTRAPSFFQAHSTQKEKSQGSAAQRMVLRVAERLRYPHSVPHATAAANGRKYVSQTRQESPFPRPLVGAALGMQPPTRARPAPGCGPRHLWRPLPLRGVSANLATGARETRILPSPHCASTSPAVHVASGGLKGAWSPIRRAGAVPESSDFVSSKVAHDQAADVHRKEPSSPAQRHPAKAIMIMHLPPCCRRTARPLCPPACPLAVAASLPSGYTSTQCMHTGAAALWSAGSHRKQASY